MLSKYPFIEWFFLEKPRDYPTEWTVGRTLKIKQAHGISALEPAGSGQLASILICMLLMNTGVKTFIKPASVERTTLQE